MVRIFIADDFGIVRRGIRAMLEDRPDFEIVGEAGDGGSAVSAIIELTPDVVVLGYTMRVLNGGEVARILRKSLPRTELLMFTMHDSESIIAEALDAGVRGYPLKSDAGTHLIEAIEKVAQRRPFISPRLAAAAARLPGPPRVAAPEVLSRREREVIRLAAEGRTNRSIGRALGVAEKTIESHRTSAMRKLGLSNIAGIVRYAMRNNFVSS